jgi:cellulose synthase/poly-beta-1,6-N-acetylglucosamine synthase-like glycosyltransferase
MLVFYFFAAIAIWLGILSVRGGLRFSSFVRAEQTRPAADYTPFVSLIAPFRGVDQGLRENLTALFNQNYPAYEVLFVTGRSDDSAFPIVEEVRAEAVSEGKVESQVVIAGEATDSGQKVHNLIAAVAEVDERAEVLAFVDTDARPHPEWLRSLVAPLVDPQLGAASSYRWFVPLTHSPATHLRAVWNASIASALGGNTQKNFCWGGATAIRSETFTALKVIERWRGSVSDDFTLTRILKEAQLPIRFVPGCLTASFEDCSFSELLEFTNRQIKITRVYAPQLWQAVLIGGLLFSPVFFGGIILVGVRGALGQPVIGPSILLLIIFALGAFKGWIRWRAVRFALANYGPAIRRNWPAHIFLWPFASALFLYNAIVAAFSRRIVWRGTTYELKSPTEAVIIAREK